MLVQNGTEMHCGMCEHDWRTWRPDPHTCPSCGSDEIETYAQAIQHNDFVINREKEGKAIRCNWCGGIHSQPAQNALEALQTCLARK